MATLGALAASALVLGGCSGDERRARAGVRRWSPRRTCGAAWCSAVAGPDADVTSIVTDPTADPHSYESSPADAAAVIDADLVVFNGGGYDEFVEKILADEPDKPTVEAVTLLPESASAGANVSHRRPEHTHDEEDRHDHGVVNEHVWYDVAAVGAVADRVATELGTLDPRQRRRIP